MVLQSFQYYCISNRQENRQNRFAESVPLQAAKWSNRYSIATVFLFLYFSGLSLIFNKKLFFYIYFSSVQ
jgi:hypothetical protein